MAMYGQGKTRGQVAKLGIDAATNQACAAILLKKGMSADFYYQVLASRYHSIREIGNGGTQRNLSGALIKEVQVPVPPPQEQIRIAQVLVTWDEAIEKMEQLIGNSQRQKQAMMTRLFSGHRLRSVHWPRMTIGDIALIDAASLDKTTPKDFAFRYITLADADAGYVSQTLATYQVSNAPSRARRVVRPGDVLVPTVRPNLQGFARVTEANADCIASTGFTVLTAKPGISADYLFHYMFSNDIQDQINAIVTGSHYPSINSGDVERLFINCPPYDEQRAIASVLDAAEEKIRAEIRQRDMLLREKQALTQQLLIGKRRLRVGQCTAEAA
jgi:type I restriction enzyme S subunit